MPGWRRLALIGIAAAAGGGAVAADLPPAPSLPETTAEAEPFAGWYLRGDVGGGIDAAGPKLEAASSAGAPSLAEPGFRDPTLSSFGMADIGAGYQFNSLFRADATFEYRGGARLRATASAPSWYDPAQTGPAFSADIASLVGLVNGYVTPGVWWGLAPFVGAGVGFADNRLSNATEHTIGVPALAGRFASGSRTSLAWALMAGVDFDITPNLRLELSYRYLSYGAVTTGAPDGSPGFGSTIQTRGRLASNDLRVGLIYLVGGAPSGPPH